jgi:uncharacterized protein YjbI with pentapeptide repeats
MNFGVTGVLNYFSAVKDIYEQPTADMQLSYMSLKKGYFSGLDLSGAQITCSDFSHSECDHVDFSGANLTNTCFKDANLENANFQGADITGATFEHARNVDKAINLDLGLTS